MQMKTGLDNEFIELNTIHLNNEQKTAIWKVIHQKSKKSATLISVRNVAISILTVAVMLILTFNLIHLNENKQQHHSSTPAPTKKVVPHKVTGNAELRDNDSKSWEIISRAYRYDIASIEYLNTNLNELAQLKVKRIQIFGTDTDPEGTVIKIDELQRTYTLQTILNQQVLQFQNGQKILLSFGQYEKVNSTDWFWGAKVLGYAKDDGKFYDMKGKPLNLTISSQVKIVDGVLNVQKEQ
jgi:hypothetical protein